MSARRSEGGSGDAGDRGDTLVEVLASVLLMSIGVITILGAIFTLLISSDTTERAARVDTVLHDVGEEVLARQGTYAYVPCTAAGTEVSYPTPTGPPDLPAGWTIQIVDVTYWDGVASQGTTGDPNHKPSPNYDPSRGHNHLRMVPTCPGGTGPRDYGVQQITLRVVSDEPFGDRGPVNDTVTVTKRNPRCPDGSLRC
jgi:Tfp pilus assembly protein PilV